MNLIAFDLDDTLYKEIDFLHSGYRAIARLLADCHGLDRDRLYDIMLHPADNAFDSLDRYLKSLDSHVDFSVADMVETYRYHTPDIKLDNVTEQVLTRLADNRDNRLALITDGRKLTQRAKIEALGLSRFISPELISISEEIGAKKSKRLPFERMMKLNPDCDRFFYIGDNPVKDFYWANKLGWTTVELLDDGRNIQSQNIVIPAQYQASIRVKTLAELPSIIN